MGWSKYALPGDLGGLGVTLFFVLSGFLITYLLFAEQQETQTINIKNFYLRRVLRIWPLYYLILFFSFFIFSHFIYPEGLEQLQKHYWIKFFLNFFLMANVSHAFIGKVPLGSNLWSVGTEEQFYLIWPWLVKKFKKSGIPILISIIVVLAIARIALSAYVFQGELVGIRRILFFFFQFLMLFRIDCMAMGALGAWILFFKKEKLLNYLFYQPVQIIVFAWCGISLWFGFTYFDTLNHIVYALMFAILILNLAGNKSTLFHLEFPFLNFLGKISYGLYVYHFICVVVILKTYQSYFDFTNSFLDNVIVYVSVFGGSILISFFSYKFFESPFLKLKNKFSSLVSGDDVGRGSDQSS